MKLKNGLSKDIGKIMPNEDEGQAGNNQESEVVDGFGDYGVGE